MTAYACGLSISINILSFYIYIYNHLANHTRYLHIFPTKIDDDLATANVFGENDVPFCIRLFKSSRDFYNF